LRILVVTNMYPHEKDPAFGTFVMQQVDALRRRGQIVDVLHIEGHKSKLRYLTGAFEVFARTRRTSYDIVHAHYGLSGLPALFRFKTPLVITLHGSDALIGSVEPFLSKMVCKLADAVIVVSKGIAKRIPGEVIPCGIDLDRFTPGDRAAARAMLNLPTDRRLVLFPYNPSRKVKRYDLALAAIELLGLRDVACVTASGVRNEEMPFYYRAADVMLLCSESEGSPTSVKEALACNIPVVATNVGDVADIMGGIDGCKVCETSADSLAAGLRSALLRHGPPFDGRTAMRKYDRKSVTDDILRVYKDVIARRGSPTPPLRFSKPGGDQPRKKGR
jgi:teichuronic acid biosynthesis glycosyltransferase TuaC